MSYVNPNSRKVILTAEQHNRIVTLCGAHPDLVKVLNDASDHTPASEDQLLAATRRHCEGSDNEVEIDNGAGVSEGDNGYWVEAWVWIAEESKA